MPENRKDQYSSWTGLVYVFNLIVGTGALTLPSVFQHAGWGLGLTLILVLGFMSYVTVTFVIESMASANALVRWKRLQSVNSDEQDNESENEEVSEDAPLTAPQIQREDTTDEPSLYYIRKKIETGEMAGMFFPGYGRTLMYACFAVYLYGDLAIYGAAVSKTLVGVACNYRPDNASCNATMPDSELCWGGTTLDRADSYRLFLTLFVCLLGPFVFFNVQKTKYLQMSTTLMRWFAFTFMIAYAVRLLATGGPKASPPLADLSGLPAMFGACVYSFMCHHSLPSLVSPITDKSRLSGLLAADYALIAAFYVLLATTGAFAFHRVSDLYTLSFVPGGCDEAGLGMTVVGYVLALFPVFALSTSYPVIAITLRDNLRALCGGEGGGVVGAIAFPLLAVIPPAVVALATADLKALVGVTGSYAGVGIQYAIPACLVMTSREQTRRFVGPEERNGFASPFSHKAWPPLVLAWALACVLIVTANHVVNRVL